MRGIFRFDISGFSFSCINPAAFPPDVAILFRQKLIFILLGSGYMISMQIKSDATFTACA